MSILQDRKILGKGNLRSQIPIDFVMIGQTSKMEKEVEGKKTKKADEKGAQYIGAVIISSKPKFAK